MDQPAILSIALAILVGVTLPACRRNDAATQPAGSAQPAPSSAAAAPGEPIAVEEVVPGKLKVRVFSHVLGTEAGPLPCWTYVSDGLLAEGQEEIVFTVKREPGEAVSAYPKQLFEFYSTVHGYAAKKQIVREGGITRLNRSGPGLLRDDLHGILYTLGQEIEGVKVPGPFLTALILTTPETDVAEQFGEVRLMSLLGNRYRFFPTAPWLDRKRQEIARPEAMGASFLGRTKRYRLSGAWVGQQSAPGAAGMVGGPGAKIVLTLTRAAGKRFREDLKDAGDEIGLAVLLDVDPEADAILVWEPGKAAPSAISKPGATGERIGGNFLVLATDPGETGARMIEDGFGLLLSKDAWRRVRAAIAEGRPIEVSGSGNLASFALAWAEESYTNAVDGRTYVGRWRTYQPSPGASGAPSAPAQSGPVKLAGIRFLQPESELNGRVSAEALAAYIQQAVAVIAAGLDGGAGAGFDLLVQFELSPPHTARVEVSGRPATAVPSGLKDLPERLQRLPVPEIKVGPVRLLAGYTVRGGTGEPIP